ncbi:Coatomer subunit beta'-1 [Hondaea fermentalgiana]|uniref:Coatomer subunit beta'-1 n=1 Tax=Hondaea fermentalgiana TaxID=2315210 RepID=A0A2R5GPL1_9STRA|nr:Coatomer subunit beta'-1 [Hondaea fermentalgiana]|eukprot:GBG32812.1 Coatomer subunit beta'-1 [Hondaea fermentalgiana]
MGLVNGSVWAVAQSEQLVVAGSGAFDPVLRAWTRRGGALVLEMATPNQAGVLAVAVRGNRAAAGTFPGAVFIVDVLAAEVVHELQGHTAAVWSVVLDDAIVTGSWDGSIRIWDEETGECVQSIFVGPKIGGIATHGNLIAAGFLVDNSVRIFDRTTEETLAVIRDAGDDVHSVAMDARHLVSASNDKKVRVYAIPSFELLNVLEGHTSWVHSVAVAGNRVVSCSWDTTIIIWDCYTSDPLLMLHGHDNAILSVSIFGSDIVSGAWDFSVKTWDLHTGALKHSPDARISCKIQSQTTRSRLGKTGSKSAMGRIGGSVWAVAQSNELIVAGSGGFDPALRAWSKEGALVLEVKTPNNAGALAVDVHGNLAVVGTYTGAVYLVDVLSGAVVYVLQGHTDAVWDVVLDGGVVFSGSWDGSIRMWDASTGVCTSTISVGSKVGGLATQDDFIVVGFKDSTVQVFSKSTGERVHIFSVPTVWAKSIAMNDKHLVTGSDDRRIRVYDVPSFELLHTLEGHTSWVNSVALDGDTIVSSSWDRTIKVWDATDGQELRTLHGHSNAVQSVSLLGSDIVSGSWDCSVKIWDEDNMVNEKDNNDDSRTVRSARVKDWRTAEKGHVEYEVAWETEDGASGTAWRRFREFDALSKEVRAGEDELPGKVFGSKSPRKRQHGLNALLLAVVKKAGTSPALFRFLRIPEDETGLIASATKVRRELLELADAVQADARHCPPDWKLCSSKNGLTSCNNPDLGRRCVSGLVPNASPASLAQILLSRMKEVETNIDTIDEVSPVGGLDVKYLVMKAMMFMRPRDVVMAIKHSRESDGTEVIVHLGLNEHPEVPAPSDSGDRKRATQSFGGMVLRPAKGGCFVLIANDLDARVSVPDSYRSKVEDYTTGMIAENLVNLRKLAPKGQKDESTASAAAAAQEKDSPSALNGSGGKKGLAPQNEKEDEQEDPKSQSTTSFIVTVSAVVVVVALVAAAAHNYM